MIRIRCQAVLWEIITWNRQKQLVVRLWKR